jgi:hypothetical protein
MHNETFRRIAVCDRLSLALRLKNRGCLVGEDSPFYNRVQCTWERGRSDDNDARALFLATRLRNALKRSGFFMLDRSLALGLRNRTVGCLG